MSSNDTDVTGSVDRRRLLQTMGAAGVVGLAGCAGGDGQDGEDTTTTEGDGEDTTTTTEDTGDEGPNEGGTITVGLPNTPPSVNGLATSSSYAWAILDYVHGYGTFLDPFNFEVYPAAYTDWEVQDVDSGEPTIFANLRDGLTFNDGEDLTLDDVLFTYEYMLDQKPGRYISTIQPIDSVGEADNDWDFRINLTQPVGTYDVNQLALPILAEHEWGDVETFNEYNPGDQIPDRPVGAGPGRITTYEPDTAIEVEFRDDWALNDMDWMDDFDQMSKGGPFLDSIRFLVYTDETAMNQAFMQGELDTLYGGARSANVEDIKDNEGQEIVTGGDTGYSYLGYNLRRTPFDDATFRQALSMVWDDPYWINRLAQGYAHEGDFVVPPGYTAARPDEGQGLEDPETQAFTFRASSPGVPDYATVRQFLTEGKVITGEGGTYAGQEYPGSYTGVTGNQSSARHDYSFGEVVSEVLQDSEAEQEIRVNGQTIPELRDGDPLVYYMYPPQLVPNLTEMDKIYVQNLQQLGIPIERKVLAFNPLLSKVYAEEDFDMYHMGWGNTSPFGISSMYSIFHSDNADDHSEDGNNETMLNNSTGYGLFDHAGADDLIAEARRTMETGPRNELARQAVEKIYLEQPYQVYQYSIQQWPIRSDKYAGYMGGIADPGMSNLSFQVKYALYQQES